MQRATSLILATKFVGVVAALVFWFSVLTLQLNAQNSCSGSQGQNGVYNATCNNGNPGVVGSSAFIDASQFGASNTNICKVGVQQKLMRHADIRTTMNIYGDAATADMRVAHEKVVRLALPQ
jgi:hypothetical protein